MQLLHPIATGAKPFPKYWTGVKVFADTDQGNKHVVVFRITSQLGT